MPEDSIAPLPRLSGGEISTPQAMLLAQETGDGLDLADLVGGDGVGGAAVAATENGLGRGLGPYHYPHLSGDRVIPGWTRCAGPVEIRSHHT